jgi:hypothetical protein
MKTQKNVVTTVKGETMPTFKTKKEFLAWRETQAQRLAEMKASKKVVNRAKTLSLSENVLLLMYVNGGISVSEILQAKPLINRKAKFNVHTECRNWNRTEVIQYAEEQYNKKGYEFNFVVTFNENNGKVFKAKYNNHISISPFSLVEVETYLTEMLTNKFGAEVCTEFMKGNFAQAEELSAKLVTEESK